MLPGTDTDIKDKAGESGEKAGNRRYSPAFKRKVVKESLVPGASVSVVARRHDINSNIVFRWRKEFREAEHDREVQSKNGLADAGFIEVDLVDNASGARLLPAPRETGGGNVKAAGTPAQPAPAQAGGKTPGLIEIETAGGVKLRLSGRVDDRALRRVLAAIRRLA
jgi:transposase